MTRLAWHAMVTSPAETIHKLRNFSTGTSNSVFEILGTDIAIDALGNVFVVGRAAGFAVNTRATPLSSQLAELEG